MSKIYVVVDDNKIPFIAYSDYSDARDTIANMFGKSLAQLNKHCYAISFCDNSKPIDFKNSKDVINLTIQATIEAYDRAQEKFIELYESYKKEEADV